MQTARQDSAPLIGIGSHNQIKVGSPIMAENVPVFFESTLRPNRLDKGVGFFHASDRPKDELRVPGRQSVIVGIFHQ